MASAWLIYVGHCIVMLHWSPSPLEASVIRQLLQETVTYVRLLSFFSFTFMFILAQLLCLIHMLLFVQSLADTCFPISEGPSASRLHGMLKFSFSVNSLLCHSDISGDSCFFNFFLVFYIFRFVDLFLMVIFWCTGRIVSAPILWCSHLLRETKTLL